MTGAQTQVVIVGGGLGGLACARRLAARGRDGLEVRLIDRKARHDFLPALPWLIVGKREIGKVSRPLDRLVPHGVRIVRAEVTDIELDRLAVLTSRGRLPCDELVLAPGAALAPHEIDGLEEAARGFYTLEAAIKLRGELARFPGGRVLLVVCSQPFRSLAAPYEAAFLINELLRYREGPAKVDVITAEPMPIEAGDPEVGSRIIGLLERRGIGFEADRRLESVDAGKREARFTDGTEPYDLLIAIPPHEAPDFVARSPLAGDKGWIPATPFGLSAAAHVHALGDVIEIELGGGATLPKAGVLAQHEGEVVADNIIQQAAGLRPRRRFRGSHDYYLDIGSSRAIRARGSFYLPRSRRVRMLRPSTIWHRNKVLFERRSLREPR